MSELSAAASAVAWGTADYCGGKASRTFDPRAVVVVAETASLPLLAVLLLVVPSTGPSWAALGWGTAGGAVGAVALVLLYGALTAGPMSVIAPVTGVTAALVPLAAGLLSDGAPSAAAVVGLVCAVAAIGLIGLGPGQAGGKVPRGLVGLALLAGAAFGVFYVVLARAPESSGLWPLVGVRIGSLAVCGLRVRHAGLTLRLTGTARQWALGVAVCDMAANALFLTASRAGHLSVAGPISALYPVITVLLAMLIDRERLRFAQVLSLCLASAALVLVHAGS
ncbi:EamA family transporter [Streptomyces sp. G5(2025)]|uniref:EamA family transporter n=1 Tax=Streptomyces sp. G5(2025) TaxID=3406628 RepID=UPI003C265B20